MKKIKRNIWGIAFLAMANVAHADNSCDKLLTMGIYNISQSSNSSEGEMLAKSDFCSYDYSLSSTTSSQQAAIEASFLSWFKGRASGGVSKSDIIETQKSVCTSGYNRNIYSNAASSYSRLIYQGALDSFGQCLALQDQGMKLEIQADSTMEGVIVSLATNIGTKGKFLGLSQIGTGTSACNTVSPKGQIIPVKENTFATLSSASKFTVVCKRNMVADPDGNLSADAQSLVFNTTAGAYQVPLSSIGLLSRSTVDQAKEEIKQVLLSSPISFGSYVKVNAGVDYVADSDGIVVVKLSANTTNRSTQASGIVNDEVVAFGSSADNEGSVISSATQSFTFVVGKNSKWRVDTKSTDNVEVRWISLASK